ncbi:MAG: redoxin domain-containing protein, partial [Pseudomonadota bacterium]
RIVADAKLLKTLGIGVAAICSNDATIKPADSFPNMQVFARTHGFGFPYLHDEDQSVARAYDAVCTPDFFGYNAEGGLQYRGRLDSNAGRDPQPGATRDLAVAMREVAETGSGPSAQIASMGCSIKWKTAA